MSTSDWRSAQSVRFSGGSLAAVIAVGLSLLPGRVRAQAPRELLSLEGTPIVAEIEDLFGRRPAQWRQAWATAQRIGPPLAVALWPGLARDAGPVRRLVRLGAVGVAAGSGVDELWLEGDWLRRASKPERLMALLVLAIGPERARLSPALHELARSARDPSVRIAACAALARGPATPPLPERWLAASRGDPGLRAAAALCGGLPARGFEPGLELEDPTAAELLVWRALLLSAPGRAADLRARVAAALSSRDGRSVQRARRAAALWVAGDPGQRGSFWTAPPVAGEAALCASTAAGRAWLHARGWLAPLPSALDRSWRAALAVAYALAASAEEIASAAPRWAAAPTELREPIYLALAWRALTGDRASLSGLPDEELGAGVGAAWLRIALGRAVPLESLPAAVPGLRLAAEGRLPAAVSAGLIEDALWMGDAHPGRWAFGVRAQLVRDLLLSGSRYARAREGGQSELSYLPADLAGENPTWFEVASEWFDWRVASRASASPGYGLAR